MNRQTDNLSIAELVRGNTILWFALLMGATMITLVLTFLIYNSADYYDSGKFLNSMFTYVAIGVAIGGVFGGNLIYQKKVASGSEIQGLRAKLNHFREAFITKAALIEGPTLVAAVLMFMEQNFYFLPLILILLIAQFLNRPTIERFKNDYQLTLAEKQELSEVGL